MGNNTTEDIIKTLLRMETVCCLVENENKDEKRADALAKAIVALKDAELLEAYKEKIKDMYFSFNQSMRGKYCTLLSQTKPENRLVSRTEIWMYTYWMNELLEKFPEAIGEIQWAKKLDWHFPKDDNKEIQKDMDKLGIILV